MTEKNGAFARRGVAPSYTKGQIVDAAFDLIDTAGIDSFSMRELAKHVGISPMGIYTYFSSREQILFQVAERMMAQYDNAPLPGEFWEDTLHRTCGSIREVSIAHPYIRAMVNSVGLRWPQHHNRNVYRLHADQGMPPEIYNSLHAVLRSYMSGYLDNETRTILVEYKDVQDPFGNGSWTRHDEDGTGSAERYHDGLDIIIAGIRAKAAPDPCEWYTPTDRGIWTWEA